MAHPAPWMLAAGAGDAPRRVPPAESAATRLGARPADVQLRRGVVQAIAAYASALRARDVGALARVYPVLTAAERQYWSGLFTLSASVDARMEPRDVRRVDDASALARVSGSYAYRDPGAAQPVRTTVEFVALLVRDARGDWRIQGIR